MRRIENLSRLIIRKISHTPPTLRPSYVSLRDLDFPYVLSVTAPTALEKNIGHLRPSDPPTLKSENLRRVDKKYLTRKIFTHPELFFGFGGRRVGGSEVHFWQVSSHRAPAWKQPPHVTCAHPCRRAMRASRRCSSVVSSPPAFASSAARRGLQVPHLSAPGRRSARRSAWRSTPAAGSSSCCACQARSRSRPASPSQVPAAAHGPTRCVAAWRPCCSRCVQTVHA